MAFEFDDILGSLGSEYGVPDIGGDDDDGGLDALAGEYGVAAPNDPPPAKPKRIRAPKEDDAAFRKFFDEHGFRVNRTFGKAINKGSLHPLGLAADIDINGKSDDEIGNLVEAALKRGYRVYDERVKRPGVKQTGPHLHFERNNGEKASSFLDGRYGKRTLKQLRELDEMRLGKRAGGGGDAEDDKAVFPIGTGETPGVSIEMGTEPVDPFGDETINRTPERIAAWNKMFPNYPIPERPARLGQMAQAEAQNQLEQSVAHLVPQNTAEGPGIIDGAGATAPTTAGAALTANAPQPTLQGSKEAIAAYQQFLKDTQLPDSPDAIKEFNTVQETLNKQKLPTQAQAQAWLDAPSTPQPQRPAGEGQIIDGAAAGQLSPQQFSAPQQQQRGPIRTVVNPTRRAAGASTYGGVMDDVASQLHARLQREGVDYNTIRSFVEENYAGADENENLLLTPERAARLAKNRQEITIDFDEAAIEQIRNRQKAKDQFRKAHVDQTRLYQQQGLDDQQKAEQFAMIDLLEDALARAVTEDQKADIKAGIHRIRKTMAERDTLAAVEPEMRRRARRLLEGSTQAPLNLQGIDAARFGVPGASLPTGGVSPQDVDREWQALQEDVYSKYASFSDKFRKETEIEEKYKNRPLARPTEFALNVARSWAKLPGVVSGLLGIGADAMSPAGVPLEQNPFFQFKNQLDKTIDASKNPDLKNDWMVTQVADAVAQITQQTLLSVATGGSSAALLLPMAQAGVPQYEEAAKGGANRLVRLGAGLVGALAGAADGILSSRYMQALTPVKRLQFLDRLVERTASGLARTLGRGPATETAIEFAAKFAANAPIGYFGEKYQEWSEDLANNLYARATYDPRRSMTPSLAAEEGYEAAGIAGLFGAGMQSVTEHFQQQTDRQLADDRGRILQLTRDLYDRFGPGYADPDARAVISAFNAEIKRRNRPDIQPIAQEEITPTPNETTLSSEPAPVDAPALAPDQPAQSPDAAPVPTGLTRGGEAVLRSSGQTVTVTELDPASGRAVIQYTDKSGDEKIKSALIDELEPVVAQTPGEPVPAKALTPEQERLAALDQYYEERIRNGPNGGTMVGGLEVPVVRSSTLKHNDGVATHLERPTANAVEMLNRAGFETAASGFFEQITPLAQGIGPRWAISSHTKPSAKIKTLAKKHGLDVTKHPKHSIWYISHPRLRPADMQKAAEIYDAFAQDVARPAKGKNAQKEVSLPFGPMAVPQAKAPESGNAGPVLTQSPGTPTAQTNAEAPSTPDWVQNNIENLYQQAESLDLVDAIVDWSGKGFTAKQVAKELELQFGAMPAEINNIIRAVRSRHNMPAADEAPEEQQAAADIDDPVLLSQHDDEFFDEKEWLSEAKEPTVRYQGKRITEPTTQEEYYAKEIATIAYNWEIPLAEAQKELSKFPGDEAALNILVDDIEMEPPSTSPEFLRDGDEFQHVPDDQFEGVLSEQGPQRRPEAEALHADEELVKDQLTEAAKMARRGRHMPAGLALGKAIETLRNVAERENMELSHLIEPLRQAWTEITEQKRTGRPLETIRAVMAYMGLNPEQDWSQRLYAAKENVIYKGKRLSDGWYDPQVGADGEMSAVNQVAIEWNDSPKSIEQAIAAARAYYQQELDDEFVELFKPDHQRMIDAVDALDPKDFQFDEYQPQVIDGPAMSQERGLSPLASSLAARRDENKRSPEDIAQLTGLDPSDVDAIPSISEAGDFGWLKHSMSRFFLDKANQAQFEELATAVLGDDPLVAEMAAEDAGYKDRRDLMAAVMDTIALQLGKDRSSQLSAEDWDQAIRNVGPDVSAEVAEAMVAAGAATAEWHRNIIDFIEDPALVDIIESARAGEEISVKAVLAIGAKYGKEAKGPNGLSDIIIRRSFARTISGRLPNSAVRRSSERAGQDIDPRRSRAETDEGPSLSEVSEEPSGWVNILGGLSPNGKGLTQNAIDLQKVMPNGYGLYIHEHAQSVIGQGPIAGQVQGKIPIGAPLKGALVQGKIKATPDEFLQFDQPLGLQTPTVIEALTSDEKLWTKILAVYNKVKKTEHRGITGEEVYNIVAVHATGHGRQNQSIVNKLQGGRTFVMQRLASEYLRRLGIKGNRLRDKSGPQAAGDPVKLREAIRKEKEVIRAYRDRANEFKAKDKIADAAKMAQSAQVHLAYLPHLEQALAAAEANPPKQTYVLFDVRDLEVRDFFVDRWPAEAEGREADEGPALSEYGEDDLNVDDEAFEIKEGRVSTDTKVLLALLGEQMYKADLFDTVIKETMQNSLDAVRQAQEMGLTEQPRIDISLDKPGRTFTIEDNGVGMDYDTILNAYIRLGGSQKGSVASGGLGMAKAAFLFGSEKVEVTTVKNGVKSEFTVTPDKADGSAVEIRTSRTTEPNGTKQVIHFPKEIESSLGTREIELPYDLGSHRFFEKPMLGDVDVRVRQNSHGRPGQDWDELAEYEERAKFQPVPIGKNFPLDERYNKLTHINFSWGEADVYISKDKLRYGGRHSVLSNGVFQFQENFKKGSGWETLPYSVIVDVHPYRKPTDPDYPFTINREGWRHTIKPDVNALHRYMNNLGAAEEFANHLERFSKIKQVPRTQNAAAAVEEARRAILEEKKLAAPEEEDTKNIVIVDGKTAKAPAGSRLSQLIEDMMGGAKSDGKVARESFVADTAIKDPREMLEDLGLEHGKPVFHNNTNVNWVLWGERSKKGDPTAFFTEIANLVQDVTDWFIEMGRPGGILENKSFKNIAERADELYAGVSIDTQYRGATIREPFLGSFLNPLAVESMAMDHPGTVAMEFVDTIVHELAHVGRKGDSNYDHGEDFVLRLHQGLSALRLSGRRDFFDRQFQTVLENNWELWKELMSK
jgi:hypothetical protein